MWIAIYSIVWFMAAAAAGTLYMAGYFNDLMLTVFGFLFSALAFMGLVALLPWSIDKHFSPKKSVTRIGRVKLKPEKI